MKTRVERDSLGDVEVPAHAYYGAQTARAAKNFPISGLKAHPEFIRATALVKRAAAETNSALGRLDSERGKAIIQATQEIIDGKVHDEFVVDVYQAGAGTSHNMNANEVIANRANELLGGERGRYQPVHPNDHVNLAQSTNDSFPTAMRIAALNLTGRLAAVLREFAEALQAKAAEFDDIPKAGRTHLQDAVPVRLGQEFAAYAATARRGMKRIEGAAEALHRLNLGATATGTGINRHPDFPERAAARLAELTGLPLRPAENLMQVTQSMSDFAELSGALKIFALDLIQIANDLRLMNSGPRTGLGEIELPPVQPGSSIMPGKVNPVMLECTNMVCFQIIGNDCAIAMATQAGQLELNVMMPVIAHNLLQSLEILRNTVKVLTERCIKGLRANVDRCGAHAESTIGLATALNPYVGYDAAAKVAQEAQATGKKVQEVVREHAILSEEEMRRVFDVRVMTEPRS